MATKVQAAAKSVSRKVSRKVSKPAAASKAAAKKVAARKPSRPAPAPAAKAARPTPKALAAAPKPGPTAVVKPMPAKPGPTAVVKPMPAKPAPVPVPPPAEPPRAIVPQFQDETPKHKVGDHVVYPGVGVCEVMNIEARHFGNFERRFYFLRVLSDRARIYLPIANAPRVGLRPIISAREANGVYTVLKNQVNKKIKDWKKRQALITEKVASGDPLKAAEVYKRLFFLSKTKGLSHGENVAFVKVRTILADELSIISGVTKDTMIAKIDRILEASYKKKGSMEIDEEEE